MAFSVGSSSQRSSGFSKRRFSQGAPAISEINIVPLVDVVLVLLIIFMLTAHVMEYGLEIDVPKVRLTANASTEELPVVSMNRNGEIFLNDKPVRLQELGAKIKAQFKDPKSVFIRSSAEARVGGFVQIIAQLSEAGLASKIVTQPIEDSRRK
jgi:biopolymer transport protein ExbD